MFRIYYVISSRFAPGHGKSESDRHGSTFKTLSKNFILYARAHYGFDNYDPTQSENFKDFMEFITVFNKYCKENGLGKGKTAETYDIVGIPGAVITQTTLQKSQRT